MDTDSSPFSASGVQDPSAVVHEGREQQLQWAYTVGERLWSIRGDNAIPPTLSEAERDEDKQEAWEVVTSEEHSIHHAAKTIADESSVAEEELLDSMRKGFYSSYDAL